MRLLATTTISFRALRRNKMRSVLTALGIIIGVAAVIAMVSIGNGAKAQVEAQMASLGQNIITVFPGSMTTGGMRGGFGSASGLTIDDAEAIKREITGIAGVSPELRERQQVLANGLNWNTQIGGYSPDILDIRSWPLAEGSMFTEMDVRTASKVCVVGQTIVDQLFPGMDPIGQTLRIRNVPFTILGTLAAKGYLGQQDQDDVIMVPYTTAMRRITRRERVNSIVVKAANPDYIDRVQMDTTDLLAQMRGGREPDFTVRNQAELTEAATAQSRTMTLLLSAIAGVSLVVGGIGIMNIMLVSVTERTREIGIRMAVGAHGKDILLQFLIESIVLSLMGGFLGILLGWGTSQLLSYYNNWPTLVSSTAVAVAFFFSGAVGVFFGFYPARKAAQLDPIDALRYE